MNIYQFIERVMSKFSLILFQPNRPKIKSLYQSFEKSSEQGMKPRCYNVYCGVVYMPAVVAVHSLKYVHAVGWCHVRSQETSPRR